MTWLSSDDLQGGLDCSDVSQSKLSRFACQGVVLSRETFGTASVVFITGGGDVEIDRRPTGGNKLGWVFAKFCSTFVDPWSTSLPPLAAWLRF